MLVPLKINISKRILVTGANGFVGSTLCDELHRRGYAVRGAVRNSRSLPENIESVAIDAIDEKTDWRNAFDCVDVVIHLAARVHVMRESANNPLEEFRKINVAGTERLARAAAESGVKRFVYVSTIKVNGEWTRRDEVFVESDEACPQDPYGISKWEAEQALHRVAKETGLEIVIVRPPLVYGPKVKGNFAQMLKVVRKGIPLPLAAVNNLRSLIYVGNLADILILCATHPAAVGQTYLVSDDDDVSTSDLLYELGKATGCPARLLSCPPILLKWAGSLFGRSEQVERLIGSLRMDSSKVRRELNWTPPYSLLQGLQATGAWL